MTKNDEIFGGLKGKQRPFLRAYFNESNKDTYLNGTASAKAAKYKAKDDATFAAIGSENLRKLKDRIKIWLDEEGLSSNRLKTKLISLVHAKKHHIIKIKGHVNPDVLEPGVIVIGESNIMAWRGQGENAVPIDDGDTILAVPIEALETQRRSLDMALKIRGEYAPEEIKLDTTSQDDFTDDEREKLKELAKRMAMEAAKGK